MSFVPIVTLMFFYFCLHPKLATSSDVEFAFNGFSDANLSVSGITSVTPEGLLQLTNTSVHMMGHAFYPLPLHFKSTTGKMFSFSTTFVFAIVPEIANFSGHGLALFISGTNDLSTADASQYLGLFNANNNGKSTDHIFAVELDTIQNPEFQDIDENHVGIDINDLKSNSSYTAGYYEDNTGLFKNLSLISGQSMQVWVDFNGEDKQLNVTLSPAQMSKPTKPLLSSTVDLASVMLDSMYIGFSSAPGAFHTYHCIQGWSFKMNGVAQALDYAKFPSLPFTDTKRKLKVLRICLPVAACLFVLLVVAIVVFVVRRIKYAEILEDWELQYRPHRFSYKDLFQATKGFAEQELLGIGGFGRVYRGVLPTSKIEVAVKKVSTRSSQGMKEFVAEIVTIGQLRHRNLVQLLGYCRRKGELLLVYDYMPNGSLDKFLYESNSHTLNWAQRFKIIKGVASGLLYLHEDWEQVVIHRDIKASNVLIDSEMNGRLGDFGLAKLYDRGTDPQTSSVVGTMGYLAPELAMVGRATTASDVYAFGALLLAVICGRGPINLLVEGEEMVLVDWVLENWQRGTVMDTVDRRLGEEYSTYEVELVLKLGLLCSHPSPTARPSMRQVMQILDGDAELPERLTTQGPFTCIAP